MAIQRITKNNIQFTAEKDAYLALQHCELCNPIITKDEYFQAKIIDYYDFNRRETDKLLNLANNWGHSMQEKGYLENFFVIYYINEKI